MGGYYELIHGGQTWQRTSKPYPGTEPIDYPDVAPSESVNGKKALNRTRSPAQSQRRTTTRRSTLLRG